MKWQVVELGDVAVVDRRTVAPDEILPGTKYVGLEHIRSGGGFITVPVVSVGDIASAKFKFTHEHVLFGKLRPYLAKIEAPSFEGVCSTDILPVLPGASLDKRYLLHYLRQPAIVDLATTRSSGANLPRLNPKELEKFLIPLPPLPEQRRIAAILDHADALRVKRREAIARLDELARSVFVDMFGDPERAAPEMVPLGAVSAISSGSTPKRSNGALYGGTTPWVKTGEVNNEVIESTEEHLTDEGVRHARLKIYPPGSILVAMYGQGATRGRVGLLGVRATTNQACAVIEPNDRILPEFMFDQLKFSYQRLRGEGRGGNQPNLNGKLVASFPVYVPDLQMQLDYCRKRASLDRSRSSMKAQLAATDSLCSSLQSRAFRGEL